MTTSKRIGAPALLVAAILVGCADAPYDLVRVAGHVTLDGKPLPGATVQFAPRGGGADLIVGPGSTATTDESGRFELRTFKGESGAVVGEHRVKISTFRQRFVDFKKSDEVEIVSEELVPPRYNKRSKLEFEVPTGGTSEADFALTTDPA